MPEQIKFTLDDVDPAPTAAAPSGSITFRPDEITFEAAEIEAPVRTAPMSAHGLTDPASVKVTGGRPAPMTANGITDPSSVRVTPAPTARISAAQPGTALPPETVGPLAQTEPPLQSIIKAVVDMFANPQVLPVEGHVAPYGGPEREHRIKASAAEIVENVGRASEGVVGLGLIVNPVSTVAGGATAMAAAAAAEQGVLAVGGSEDDARLARDIAGAAVATYATAKIRQGLAKGGAAARAARADQVPEPEPINVGRSATPAARPRIGVETEQNALPSPPPPTPTAPAPDAPAPVPPAPPAAPAPVAAPVVVPIERVWADLKAAAAGEDADGARTAIAELNRRGVSDAEIQAEMQATAPPARPTPWDGVDRRAKAAIDEAKNLRRRADDIVAKPLPSPAQIAEEAAARNPALQNLSDRVSGRAVVDPVTNETVPIETAKPGDVVTITPADVTPAPSAAPKPDKARLVPVRTADGGVRWTTEPIVEPPAPIEAKIAEARESVNTEPTDAQKEAGNYAKGHVVLHGLDITIENPKGSERKGVNKHGEEWSVTMPADYGYIKRTEGADGDHVDVYIGDKPDSQRVFVVDQIDVETGKFDEHKAILGANTEREAAGLYARGFTDGLGFNRIGAITEMPVEAFKTWAQSGDTSKPLGMEAEREPVQEPSTASVDARERAGDGEAVGEGDPEQGEAPEARQTSGARITVNQARSSVEVAFATKPERAVLDKLKAAGFRWAKTNKVWYRKGSASGLENLKAQAQTIVGEISAAPAKIRQPETQAQDATAEPDQLRPYRALSIEAVVRLYQEGNRAERSNAFAELRAREGEPEPVAGETITVSPDEIDVDAQPRQEGVESPHGAPDDRVDAGQLPASRAGATEPAGAAGEDALETVSPERGEGARAPEPASPGLRDSGGVVADGVRDTPAVDEGPVDAANDGGESAPVPVSVSPAGATHDPGARHGDYTLTPERIQAIISRGAVTRAKDNLASIRLVKTLKAEARYATPDEQELLAKYVGWGDSQVAQYLENYPRRDWSANERAIWEEIQGLSDDERKAIVRSTTNAHFTFDLYRPIWEALERAGFSGGRVLEPAVGVGHAFGFMPPDLRIASTLSASELEPLTAAIAGYLYPTATVQAVGYEKALIARGTQDLVLSNVPFGDFGVEDRLLPDYITQRIHNYFFAKALEHTRPGGLVVFVTSRYTLDNVAFSRVRQYLTEQADFLGAVRLPNTAFDKSAKTEVVTDLIVLRKRDGSEEGEGPHNALFREAEEHPDLPQGSDWRGRPIGGKVFRSTWYAAHPELIIGTESREGTMRAGGEYTVTAPREGLLDKIKEGLEQILPPGTYRRATRAPKAPAEVAEGPFKVGEYRVNEKGTGIEIVNANGEVTDATPRRGDVIDKGSVDRIKGMVGIRDALRTTTALMRDPSSTDKAIQTAQRDLKKRYDAFVAKHKELNNPANKRLFAADPEATNLLGLERLEAKATETTRKDGKRALSVRYQVVGLSDIFTKRSLFPPKEVEHVDTPKDALLASLGLHAAIDWPYMTRISGLSTKDLGKTLIEQGLIFEQPDGSHALAEEYLSGDVVTKWEDAKASGKRYASNVAALEAVLPAKKTKDDIAMGVVAINLGAGWVDPVDYAKFADKQLGRSRRSVSVHQSATATLVAWSVQATHDALAAAAQHPLAVKYGGGTYDFLDMFGDALNLKMPDLGHWEGSGDNRIWVKEPEATMAARANLDALHEAWLQYVYEDEGLQDRVLDVYNTRYNRTVERQFDGSHLTFPGAATLYNAEGKELQFHPHQKNGVWRILTTGNTLLAHEVGAGKTFEMILAAMEMKRSGRARKPMIVVPTYLLKQWQDDIVRLYPSARVAAFDEKDLEAKKRQTAMARIAYNEWDIVLVPHSSFGLLKVSEQRVVDMMERWIAELEGLEEELGKNHANIKAVERQRRKLEDKVRKKTDKLREGTDNALTWEELGVDALFIDEAHAFKNLFFYSKLENLRGLSRSESERALDLFVKVQEINEQSHHRNLVLATATPLMNSMAEVYTMQRYLQPQVLRQYGFENFDSWYATFAKASLLTEQQPDGTYKEVRRLRDFSNLKLLAGMIRQVMDYVGWEDMPYLKLPKIAGGKIEIVQTDPHPMYGQVREWFAQRMQNIRDKPPHYDYRKKVYVAPVRPHPITGSDTGKVDNILTIMNDAKKAAVDLRLVLGEYAADYPGSRLQVAAGKMADLYKQEHANKGVQLIFLDMGTPKTPAPLEFLRDVALEDDTAGELKDEDEIIDDEGEDVAVVEDDSLFNLYDALKTELVKRGVPAREIAYIHQANKSAERIALFQAAQKGDVRFVFASTDKGGVGMNIQHRLVAIHELDAPRAGRPGDLRQRMGRGIRQGNSYPNVHLVRYVTKGTTDEWLWGMLTTKDYQIRQFMKGDANSLTEEDPSTMSLAEAQMRASGDPRTIELVETKGKLARLEAQASAAERAMAQAKTDAERGAYWKARYEKDLADLSAWLKKGYTSMRGDAFTVTIDGTVYTDRAKADAALVAVGKRMATIKPDKDVVVGEIGGVPITATGHGTYETKDGKAQQVDVATFKVDGEKVGAETERAVVMSATSIDQIGAGMKPSAGIVNAYEKLPSYEKQLRERVASEADRVASAARTLANPSKAIEEAKRAKQRIAELETILKAEGLANEAARTSKGRTQDQPASEPVAERDEPEVAGMASAVGTLPPRPQPQTETVALPISEIVNKLSLIFDKVPVSVGHYKQRFRAIYKMDAQAVRSRKANDLYAIAHEFGHHLDMALMRGSAIHKRGDIAQELKQLGAPTSKPSYTAAMRRAEGAAEFFRIWLIEPERLPLEAPKYLAEFDRYMVGHPEIHAGILEVRDDIQQYLSLSGLEQLSLHINFTGGSTSILSRAQRLIDIAVDADQRRDALAYLSAQWVDDLAWLNRAERDITKGNPIDITQSAYVLARLASGASEKAEGFLRFGVRNAAGQIIGTSLDKAIAPVVHRLHDFDKYRVAVHAQELHAEGIETGLAPGQVAQTIAALRSPEFDTALDNMRDFYRAKRQYLVESGILSPQGAKAMEKRWLNYVPFQRVIETGTRALGGKKIANRTSPLKRMKGSAREIIHPLESDIRNTHTEVTAAETNKAMLALVKLVTGTPGTAKWLEEIPAPEVPTRFKLETVHEAIREDLENIGVDLPADFSFEQVATVWTPRQFARDNERFVTVIDNGRIRWFEVHEPGLYDAITAVGPKGVEELTKLFQIFTQGLRKYATATLGFIVRNPFRDIPAAMVNSRAGFNPLDFLRGLFSYLKHDEDYQLFLNSGAAQGTMVAADRDVLRQRLNDLGKTKARQILDHTILGPIDGLQALSAALENATRLGEFKKTLQRLGRDEAGLMQAGLNARDVTQDFSVAGRNVRNWNRYVAFFAARVGGVTRLAQSIREGGGGKPPSGGGRGRGGFGNVGDNGNPGPMGFLWKVLLAVTLPSVLLWILNHDDEEYRQLPAWERNAYWHIPLRVFGGGTGFIRIIKPFEIGQLFGSSAEVALDFLYQTDPSILQRLPDITSAKQLLGMIVPTAVLPLVEVTANYDVFRDRAIVNPWDTDLEPELQYNRWTSETAKDLGRWLHLSPAKIEVLIYGYTAGVGRGILQGIDALTTEGQKKPASGWSQWPGIGAFYRAQATSDAQSLTDFYDARDRLAGVKASIKRLQAAKDVAGARALMEAHRELLRRQGAINATDRQLTAQRKTITAIFESPTMTPAEKRVRLDAAYLAARRAARRALGQGPRP